MTKSDTNNQCPPLSSPFQVSKKHLTSCQNQHASWWPHSDSRTPSKVNVFWWSWWKVSGVGSIWPLDSRWNLNKDSWFQGHVKIFQRCNRVTTPRGSWVSDSNPGKWGTFWRFRAVHTFQAGNLKRYMSQLGARAHCKAYVWPFNEICWPTIGNQI